MVMGFRTIVHNAYGAAASVFHKRHVEQIMIGEQTIFKFTNGSAKAE